MRFAVLICIIQLQRHRFAHRTEAAQGGVEIIIEVALSVSASLQRNPNKNDVVQVNCIEYIYFLKRQEFQFSSENH